MPMGEAPPEVFASAACIQNAPPTRSVKSPAFVCLRRNPETSVVARRMRPLFRPRGGAVRQGALAANDVDVSSDDEGDFAVWATYRKVEKQSGVLVDGDGAKKGRR